MRLSFFTVDPAYCDRLRKYDFRVPYTFDGKERRPFVGIVFQISSFNYYAPLSSPKPKHQRMKNQVDFLKIAGGVYGAINFNNMIPILPDKCQKIDIANMPINCEDDEKYKNLLINQISWCNSNIDNILNKAFKLYELITTNRAPEQLAKRCCNFILLENICYNYDNRLLERDYPREGFIRDRIRSATEEYARRKKEPASPKRNYIDFDR